MSKINYVQLEIARQLRQKTQKEVSDALGIPQASLSKAENGLLELQEDTLYKLSVFYDVPMSFFMRQEEKSPVGHLYYRKRLTISNKVIDAFLAKVRIFKAIIEDLMSAFEVNAGAIKNYIPDDDLSPKEIAQKVRYDLGIYYGPVPNLATLLENNGVIVVRFDFGSDKIDGLSTVTDNNIKIMFINSRMPNDRIRFSMAHELGHLVMHIGCSPVSAEDAELQADEFASEFLMPEKEIRPMLHRLDLTMLSQLKKKWRVSMHALVRRAKDLDVISYQQYRNIQIMFSKKGYTKNEPIPLPIDTPLVLDEVLRLYKCELGYSDEDLMKFMRINQTDYNNWFIYKSNVLPFLQMKN